MTFDVHWLSNTLAQPRALRAFGRWTATILLSSLVISYLQGTRVLASQDAAGPRPDRESAARNAHRIFNAVHSAGRQWGSALNHNGFGYFPAIVPKGTVLYHGSPFDYPPANFEWLAFEIEHAENFAMSVRLEEEKEEEEKELQYVRESTQKPLDPREPRPGDTIRGYLQTYQAYRDLNLLYIDGMSAGKSSMGTLDSQDFVLLENRTAEDRPMLGEMARGRGLCDLVTPWGYDGVVRTEIGLEVIHCNFSSGIKMTSVVRTQVEQDKLSRGGATIFSRRVFQWARAAGQRYDGVQGGRLRLDFSSMSSGFFLPLNISNTDPRRPDLVRLGAADSVHREALRRHVEHVATRPRTFTVNWQGVSDMVVARFSDSLALMNWPDCSPDVFIAELERSILTFVNAPPLPEDINKATATAEKNTTLEAVSACTNHHLLPALFVRDEWGLEDELIHTAFKTVLQDACTSLFSIWTMLLEASHADSATFYHTKWDSQNDDLGRAVQAARNIVKELVKRLAWTVWRKQRPCPPGEVLFVAMWPFGADEDHWNPGCRTIEQMSKPPLGYWDFSDSRETEQSE